MEPKKARIAIAATIVTAIAIILLCILLLLDNGVPANGKVEESAQPTEAALTDETSAAETPDEPEEPEVPVRTPGPEDLKGSSDALYLPKPENYLPEYVTMIVFSEKNGSVYLQYRPAKKEYMRDVIMELDNNTSVVAIARENGYTLVLVEDGLAGWILTQDLDSTR